MIQVRFYSTRSFRHRIELRRRTLLMEIAEPFQSAPLYLLSMLGIILFSKVSRLKIESGLRKAYRMAVHRAFAEAMRVRRRAPSSRYDARGRYFNLDELFDELNDSFFNNTLPKPILGWSLNKAYTRLGFFAEDKNLLVISRIFDNKKVPEEIIRYLLFHEMLHIAFPVKKVNGRRIVHSLEFRKAEQEFPGFQRINHWINRYRHRL